MEYRILPHGGEKISVIGLGMGYIHNAPKEEIEETVSTALDHGVNYFDLAASEEKPFTAYGRAFAGRREHVVTQMHLGTYYPGGEYGWTRDLATIREEFSRQLKLLGITYTDVCFIHCVDELDDLQQVYHSGLWDYARGLKEDGLVRHLGFSSHNPEVAQRFLDTGLVDLFMFSINPAYDYAAAKGDDLAMGSAAQRAALYRRAEKQGVGITVMKAFGGGQLLGAETSPFGKALTRNQCIQYALDQPAVLTVLPGVRGKTDLLEVLSYLQADGAERDYGVLHTFAGAETEGVCVYCNHCQPCPGGLNVGMINKYYDLARAGDVQARGHYEKLGKHASDCTGCGHCEQRCPFHVRQRHRMKEINTWFSK